MKNLISLLFILSFVPGCTSAKSPADVAREYIQSWRSMGMYLPENQVPFFADHYSSVSDLLADALSHPNEDTRQRAAYVVEELGQVAASLEGELFAALQSESSRLVRLYHYNALRSIEASDSATINGLRERLSSLPEKVVGASDNATYTTTDERIYLASVLYVLDSSSEAKADYLSEVAQWLSPPPDELDKVAEENYWEHRWCAVNAVEHMAGARKAIPLLQAMLKEEPTKPWVSVHVPRAIASLKTRKDAQPAASGQRR